jgi:hypothetical protein
MKLKIFFVLKLMFFVSIELSAPYVTNEDHPEIKLLAETKVQTF